MNRLNVFTRATLVLLSLLLLPAKAYPQGTAGNSQFKEIQIATEAFSLGDPIPSWVDQMAIPEPNESQPVVVRLADTQYLLGPKPVVFVRRAVMINDAASLNSVGHLPIAFVPQYHQLKLHTVRVLRGGEGFDRTASSTVRFLERERGLEQGVYSGEVTASVLVSDLRVGDTLEYSYSRYGQNPVYGDKFVDTASWDQGLPTALRRVVLHHPASRRVAWRVIGDRQAKSLTPKESTHDGMHKLVFEEQSIPKVDLEPMTPPDYEAYRWIQFSEFSDWADVVGWATGLFQFNGELNAELREVVEKLRNKPTSEDRVVAALEFVQTEIRYFSVSLGESSHRPSQPDVVLQRRYGDCKDKSLLLLTLLKALGIEAKPVLLEYGRRKRLDNALPSPQVFNHVIVQVTVDGKLFYLDPTRLGQHGRLRHMGQAHEGTQVLVVAPGAAPISTIASTNARELSHSEWAETASLSKFSEEGHLQVRQVWHGTAAEGARLQHERLPRDQIVKSVANAMEPRYPGARIVGEPDFQDDRVNNVVSMTAQYAVPKFATERDGNWFVRFFPGNMRGVLASPPSSTRTVPLFLPAFPYDGKYTFEVKFPEDVSVVSDPKADTVKNKHFNYVAASSFRGNVFKATLELQTLASHVDVRDLPKFAEDVRAVGNIATGVAFVPKSAIKSARAGAAAKKDFAQTLRERLQETVEKTTQTIKADKLGADDLAATYCLRSTASSSLGMTARALSDANEAVKLTPNSSGSLTCRANVYFEAGDFEKSVADFSKAIALGETERFALHHRGVSKFYAGRIDDAAEDFLKATETGDKEGQVYSDLWLSWAHQRLGKSLPEAVLQRAAAQPRGDWPRPALAVMTGNLTPEDMLKLLDRKSGDDRKMAYAEGYFYLGQYYLGRGDKLKARELFQKTRELNVVLYMEHVAAGFELQRLGAPAEKTARRAPESASDASIAPPADGPATGTLNAQGPSSTAPEVKKAIRKPPRKAPDAWTTDIWKQQ